jgi:hypothetical protein
VITRRHPMTNLKPTRFSATASGGLRAIISEPHTATDDLTPHLEAIRALRAKGFTNAAMVGGWLKDGSVVWVFVDDRSPRIEGPGESVLSASESLIAAINGASERDRAHALRVLENVAEDQRGKVSGPVRKIARLVAQLIKSV